MTWLSILGTVFAALFMGAVKLFLGRKPKTAADQRAADATEVVRENVEGAEIADNVVRLSDAELNQRLRARSAGRE
jgi:hypothetical protein